MALNGDSIVSAGGAENAWRLATSWATTRSWAVSVQAGWEKCIEPRTPIGAFLSMNEIGSCERPRSKFYWEFEENNGIDWSETWAQ